MKSVRIGSGAGYAGDRIEPALELADRGALDFLAFECLAERTIASEPLAMLHAPAAGYKLDQAAGTERGRQQLQVALVGEALAMAWPAGRATLHEARRAVAGAYGSLGSQHPMGDRYGDFRAVADAAARELQGRWRDREADAPATAARNPRAKATAGLGELQGGKVQAVAFPRADWTNKSARDWCKRNDFRTGRPTHTSGYFRFRQYDPEDLGPGARFRTKVVRSGRRPVNLIVGWRK